MNKLLWAFSALIIISSCNKNNTSTGPAPGQPFHDLNTTINDSAYNASGTYNVLVNPKIKILFSAPINQASVASSVSMTSGNSQIPLTISYDKSDSMMIVQPSAALSHLLNYTLNVSTDLHSTADSALKSNIHLYFVTTIDSTDKFPRVSDSTLLTLVQQQTFKYFWDFGHPVSGLSRERNSSGDIVTTGGSGFGIMAIITGIQRNFISRTDGLSRLTLMVRFSYE